MTDKDFLAEMLGHFGTEEAAKILEAAVHYRDGLISGGEFLAAVDAEETDRRPVAPQTAENNPF